MRRRDAMRPFVRSAVRLASDLLTERALPHQFCLTNCLARILSVVSIAVVYLAVVISVGVMAVSCSRPVVDGFISPACSMRLSTERSGGLLPEGRWGEGSHRSLSVNELLRYSLCP